MALTQEDWNLRHFETYKEQVRAGEHDRKCEQQVRSSLCHCSKRRREREGKTELPTLHFPYPECNGCGNEVDHDGDSFFCATCKVTWSSRDATDGSVASHFTDEYGADFDGESRQKFGGRLLYKARLDGAYPKDGWPDEEDEGEPYRCPGTYQASGLLGSVCDTCGDMSNSQPGLPCGRTEDEED